MSIMRPEGGWNLTNLKCAGYWNQVVRRAILSESDKITPSRSWFG